MGLWILEDKVMDHVPGTTRYFDKPHLQEAGREDVSHLKCDTSGADPIILVPQPSDDPNDPLNWPLWKRDVIMFVLSLTAIFATALGPILAANTLSISEKYGRTVTDGALLTGYFLFGVGFAGTFFVPSARKWGKRHLLIFGTILLVASSAWAGAAELNYTSMLWARIFQGVANAPFEALINAIVGDLYFVHERGKRMALMNFALFGGAFFTPILAGKISNNMGVPWIFNFVAIFCALCLPAVIFFVPETAYRRDPRLNTDMLAASESTQDVTLNSGLEATQTNGNGACTNGNENEKSDDSPPSTEAAIPLHRYPGADTPKRTYIQSLKPFSGTYTDENFFKILLRPFPLFFHPAILWACLIQGTLIGWTIFIGILVASIFLGSPNYWGEVESGYAYTGPFIGALIGFLIAGALADWSAKFMTRRNEGIYEPEFRIVLVIPQLVFGCAGLYGFGIVATDLVRFHWAWAVFFYCLEVMGMVVGAVASSLYIIDAHRRYPFFRPFTIPRCFRRIPFSSLLATSLLTDRPRQHRHRGIHLPPHLQELLQLWPHLRGLQVGEHQRHAICFHGHLDCSSPRLSAQRPDVHLREAKQELLSQARYHEDNASGLTVAPWIFIVMGVYTVFIEQGRERVMAKSMTMISVGI